MSGRNVSGDSSEPNPKRMNFEEKTSDFVEKLLEGKLLKKIEQVVQSQLCRKEGNKLNGDNINENGADCSKAKGSEGESDKLETFDPDDRYNNIDRWLEKIDQLGATYGWSDRERSYFMQMKLKGRAREWFNRQKCYELSWAEWKVAISQAYRRNYPAMFRELLARVKNPEETMTSYYHSKLALCRSCEIDGEKAISFLIDGLPGEIQASALATHYKTPQEFYSNFLAPPIESRGESVADSTHRKRRRKRTNRVRGPKLDEQFSPMLPRCHICKELLCSRTPFNMEREIKEKQKYEYYCQKCKTTIFLPLIYKRVQQCLVPRPGGGVKWAWIGADAIPPASSNKIKKQSIEENEKISPENEYSDDITKYL